VSRLYKKFVNEKVSKYINQLDRIRNCTVIAHIDHGKTTLTDSLIASSGLLSKEVAATALLLDYDLIEQERGITIKASSISLIHNLDDRVYLVHLVDTPGHIDFSSHVTRGLRLTDGAIIVVDAIEGVMVQTETVTRQAMQELVKPILFINKIDRLITEKKMNEKKIAEQVDKTVREFNAMLGKFLDDDLLEQWEVSFKRGTLCIGSALDKWGIGLGSLKRRCEGSEDVSDLANAFMEILGELVEEYQKEEEAHLIETYPIAQTVLDSVVLTMPNPRDAQSYRIPLFWKDIEQSSVGQDMIKCKSDASCVLIVGDVQPDKHANTVIAGRILSGILKRAEPLKNLRTGFSRKSLQTGIFMSKARIPLQEIPAGNLVFVTGLRDVVVGDTLVTEDIGDLNPMKVLQYPTEPVVTYTVEPRHLADLSIIQEPIMEFVQSDPALEFEINKETGEMLLSGAGELHVEVSLQKLERQGIQLTLGKPMVLLKEQLTVDGESKLGKSESGSRFVVQAILSKNVDALEKIGNILDSELTANCFLVDATKKLDPMGNYMEWIVEAFRTLIRYGPVEGERMRNLTVIIKDVQIKLEADETSWRDITQPMLDAIRESVLSGQPAILEPWLKLELSAPEEHIGTLTSILARRKGQVLEIQTERTLARIEAELPIRESFGLANEIRTSTSGWASWGAQSGGYRSIRNYPRR
jgi:elongation factor 2